MEFQIDLHIWSNPEPPPCDPRMLDDDYAAAQRCEQYYILCVCLPHPPQDKDTFEKNRLTDESLQSNTIDPIPWNNSLHLSLGSRPYFRRLGDVYTVSGILHR